MSAPDKPLSAGADPVRRLAELESIATHVLELVTSLGVEHAEVACSDGERLEVGVRDDAIELLKEARSSGVSVRVIKDGRVATSGSTDLRRDALATFARRVVDLASISEPDPFAAPPDPADLATQFPDLALFDARTASLDAAVAIERARAGERAARAHDARITASEGASVSRSATCSTLVTSGGFRGGYAAASHYLAVRVVADDEGGKKRNGSHWAGGRLPDAVPDPAAIGVEAARRAIATVGSRKLETCVLPVIFEREAAADLVGLVAGLIVGDALYREQSYLRTRLGTPVASARVTITDDPSIPHGPGSRPFDGEGRAVRPITVVEAGVLRSFLLDTYSARKLGMEPTGSAGGGGGMPYASTSNFVMQAGTGTLEDLLAGVDRGLLVTDMMGFGFNPVTGDFSRGAVGFLIEGGRITDPISEITISRNLDEVLLGIDAVAGDLDDRSSVMSPSFRVDRMTISGSS